MTKTREEFLGEYFIKLIAFHVEARWWLNMAGFWCVAGFLVFLIYHWSGVEAFGHASVGCFLTMIFSACGSLFYGIKIVALRRTLKNAPSSEDLCPSKT